MSYEKVKRFLDVSISTISLVPLTPLLIIVGISLIDENEKIIFKQKRTGKNGSKFYIYKFRTIKHIEGKEITTDYCKLLRKLGIDELPQLINVLKGDMSLIGPRPRVNEYYENYSAEQRKSLEDTLPGLFHPVTLKCAESESIIKKVQLEVEYAKNKSLKTDLGLVFEGLINLRRIISSRCGVQSNKNTVEDEIRELAIHNKKEVESTLSPKSLDDSIILANNKKRTTKDLSKALGVPIKRSKPNSNQLYLYQISTERSTTTLTNLEEVLVKLIKLYGKALEEEVVLNPYHIILQVNNNKADIVVTEESIKVPTHTYSYVNEFRMYINLFLDFFMGFGFGKEIMSSKELREELERLNSRVIDKAFREYRGPKLNIYGNDKKIYQYKLPLQ